MRKYYFNENYFETIDTEEKAYWLGFIAADGSINKSSKYNSFRLVISLSIIDIKHLEKFLHAINGENIPIMTIVNRSGFSNDNGTVCCRITINSYKLCSDLMKYNIHQNKSYDIDIPEIENKLIKHYLRGFVDGDGSFHYHYDQKNNRYRYSFEIVGASMCFMKNAQEFLFQNNINVYIYVRKSNKSIRLMSGSRKTICDIIHFLYDNSIIYLDRKYQYTQELLKIAA